METDVKLNKRREFGNLICFGFIEGEPLFCIGPHWRYSLCLLSTILLINSLFTFIICPPIGKTNTILGVLFFSFLLLSYFLAVLVSPGIEMNTINYKNLEFDDPMPFCKLCEVYKADKTEHCYECGVCIEEFDHHCIWTGKCIGKDNINFFYGSLIGLLLCLVYSIVTLAMRAQIT